MDLDSFSCRRVGLLEIVGRAFHPACLAYVGQLRTEEAGSQPGRPYLMTRPGMQYGCGSRASDRHIIIIIIIMRGAHGFRSR